MIRLTVHKMRFGRLRILTSISRLALELLYVPDRRTHRVPSHLHRRGILWYGISWVMIETPDIPRPDVCILLSSLTQRCEAEEGIVSIDSTNGCEAEETYPWPSHMICRRNAGRHAILRDERKSGDRETNPSIITASSTILLHETPWGNSCDLHRRCKHNLPCNGTSFW